MAQSKVPYLIADSVQIGDWIRSIPEKVWIQVFHIQEQDGQKYACGKELIHDRILAVDLSECSAAWNPDTLSYGNEFDEI